MISLLLIFAAMGSQDILQALYTRALGDHRPWRAGNADGLGDLLAYGVVGVSIYDHPHRTAAWLIAALVVLYVSSVLGTLLGYRVEGWLDHRKIGA